jgi:hypothetical protein
MLQRIRGGERETVLNELIVIPIGFPDELIPVITVTPVGKLEKARLSS